MTDFKMIPLKQISPDPNQPRKYYDEVAMQELTASVKEKGILQPILIRPNGKGYKLVCGERRIRAATAAELADIPAVIRELTDEEALEIQIIENLQRKDVNPMEEGQAFKMLKEKMSIEDIAHRVGKGPAYVAQRLKLCDLIPGFQELLFADRMKLGLAFKIARLQEKEQQEIYREARVPKDWAKKKDWELPSWVRISKYEYELDSASFKTEDPNLYPEAGPCNTCQHNSHFNKLLFPELQKKRICHNGVCFRIKSQRAYKETVENAVRNPDILFASTKYYMDKEDKEKVKAVGELGVTVLDREMIEVIEEPEPLVPWDEFLEEQKEDDFDFDNWEDLSTKEQKKKEAEYKDDYSRLQEQYNEELKEYKDAEAAGLFKKAFVVAGNNEGQIINVRIKGKKGISKENAAAGDNVDLVAIESEISDIRDREKRNQELDREKVYKRVITELMKEDDNSFLVTTSDLSVVERAALLYALGERSYIVRDMIATELKVKDRYGVGLYQAILKNLAESSRALELLNVALRCFISETLISQSNLDYGKNGAPAAIYNIAQEYWKKEVEVFNIEQIERSTKRQANVNKRLDALAAKKKELQAAAKKSPKKSK